MKQSRFVQLLVLALVASLSAWAADNPKQTVCEPVAGVLMPNINAIPLPTATNGTNLGPAQGDTIKFDVAHLKPSSVVPSGPFAAPDLVAVRWGDYIAHIVGGTGKYAGATGSIDTFGLADFTQLTLVLRYRGEVCYQR